MNQSSIENIIYHTRIKLLKAPSKQSWLAVKRHKPASRGRGQSTLWPRLANVVWTTTGTLLSSKGRSSGVPLDDARHVADVATASPLLVIIVGSHSLSLPYDGSRRPQSYSSTPAKLRLSTRANCPTGILAHPPSCSRQGESRVISVMEPWRKFDYLLLPACCYYCCAGVD